MKGKKNSTKKDIEELKAEKISEMIAFYQNLSYLLQFDIDNILSIKIDINSSILLLEEITSLQFSVELGLSKNGNPIKIFLNNDKMKISLLQLKKFFILFKQKKNEIEMKIKENIIIINHLPTINELEFFDYKGKFKNNIVVQLMQL
jgi:hypothetical protein